MTEEEIREPTPEEREKAADLSLKIGNLCQGEMVSTIFLALVPLFACALSTLSKKQQGLLIKELIKELKENLKFFNKMRTRLSSEGQQSE